MTATFLEGTQTVGTVPLSVNGNSGALLFAASTNQAFTSVVLTADAGANGFALAQPRYHLAQADLSVVKTVSQPQVNPGGGLQYTITVTNNGPDDAVNAAVVDPLPVGTTLQLLGWPADWTESDPGFGNNGTVTFTTPVASGALATLEIGVNVGSSFGFTQVPQPVAAYTAATTNMAAAIPPDGSTTTAIADGTQAVSFSQTMTAATVPAGGWNNWESPPNTETNTPRVLFNQATGSVTLSLSNPATALGVEMEADTFGTYTMDASFFRGTVPVGTITRQVTTPSGSLLFAAQTDQEFTSVVLSTPGQTPGIGIAEVRYAVNPVDPLLFNTVTVGSDTLDPNTANNSATVVDEVVSPDVFLNGDVHDNQFLIQQDGTGYIDFYKDGVPPDASVGHHGQGRSSSTGSTATTC